MYRSQHELARNTFTLYRGNDVCEQRGIGVGVERGRIPKVKNSSQSTLIDNRMSDWIPCCNPPFHFPPSNPRLLEDLSLTRQTCPCCSLSGRTNPRSKKSISPSISSTSGPLSLSSRSLRIKPNKRTHQKTPLLEKSKNLRFPTRQTDCSLASHLFSPNPLFILLNKNFSSHQVSFFYPFHSPAHHQ